jgi:fatty acid desaturase
MLIGHFALWCSLPVHYLGWSGAALCYAAGTMFTGIYLGFIIPVNHVGMPTVDPAGLTARSFIVQQLTTTRNIESSAVRDFLMIGQGSQIEHHLFPWAPTFRLRRGRPIVRAFCREHGLPYHECSYSAALREVHHHFSRLARMAAHAPARTPAHAPVDCPMMDRSDGMLPRTS